MQPLVPSSNARLELGRREVLVDVDRRRELVQIRHAKAPQHAAQRRTVVSNMSRDDVVELVFGAKSAVVLRPRRVGLIHQLFDLGVRGRRPAAQHSGQRPETAQERDGQFVFRQTLPAFEVENVEHQTALGRNCVHALGARRHHQRHASEERKPVDHGASVRREAFYNLTRGVAVALQERRHDVDVHAKVELVVLEDAYYFQGAVVVPLLELAERLDES